MFKVTYEPVTVGSVEDLPPRENGDAATKDSFQFPEGTVFYRRVVEKLDSSTPLSDEELQDAAEGDPPVFYYTDSEAPDENPITERFEETPASAEVAHRRLEIGSR